MNSNQIDRANRQTAPDWFYTQSAVVPFIIENEKIKILLITSRKKKRWIIPKGVVEPDLTPSDSAAQEAFEEAGIKGDIYPNPIGEYQYKKWGSTCTVTVFLMKIEMLLLEWPESYRDRIWVGVKESKIYIQENKLQKIIEKVPFIYANLISDLS